MRGRARGDEGGAFLLIDKQGRIRGKYDGTKEEEVNRLVGDIKKLKLE
jgi:protein SCO1/2